MFALEELQEQIAGELLTYAQEILRDHEEMTGVPLGDAEEMYEVLVQNKYPGLLARNAVRARDVYEFIELLEKDPDLIRAAEAAQGWDNEDYFRWTYTAITRARRSLLVVRPPAHTATSDLSWSETTRAVPVSAPSTAGEMNPDRLLARAGISLREIQDMPYRRRIICTRDGCSARVDLIYNARHVITGVQPVGPGDALAQEVVRILEPLRGTVLEVAAGEADAPDPEPFVPPPDFFEGQPHLAAFYERMCALLEGTDIFIKAITHYPWMERYTFRRRSERAEINFWYNGKGRFTKASPVHPTALARDIYDRWSGLSET